ncbi:hypothetical protein QBC34DRAFT_358660 [Podospora aff. communis PSN243]|uniref:Uncharacterized protein n=1 Tax=Podospora aff. communis PSN243 TaxID=3040156 RepID=A0AAV9GCS5_9PEZI|nr:hypothetical protein QBC34DRAFT_358660 [Podospora aff. communis PSN243]
MDSCLALLAGIRNGTREFEGVTNETLALTGWLWDGPIALLSKDVPRDSITAMTYEGCRKLCAGTEMNTPKAALTITTTWIFPLAILFGLPYDSLHCKKFRKTVSALSNWLGSPQTAITSTIFNFDQIRKCHRQSSNGTPEDTYYVLSCFNQFTLPTEGGDSQLNGRFAKTLIYGLFRPLRDPDDDADIQYTKQLLALLAFQLRLLRRRGVVPMMLSLGTFLAAFVFSIYQAFGATGEGVDVTALTLGLLYSWLPMLVICSIVDRNPVSSDRIQELMSRWLFNVEAVRKWKMAGADPATKIEWWKDSVPTHFKLRDFVGQGRRMHYCGLAHATMFCVTDPKHIDDSNGLDEYDVLAQQVIEKLNGRRPGLWFSSAVRAFLLVWLQIFMSFLVAITSPTAGIGCWSGSIMLFGVLTSFSWFVSLFKKSCGPKLRIVCHTVNITAILFLIFLTGLTQLTGAMNNCYCNTNWFAYPHSGGYMAFGAYEFIRSNYDVVAPCAVAAAVGLSVPMGFFAFEMLWWTKCKHLWKTNERDRPIPLSTLVQADMNWLQ